MLATIALVWHPFEHAAGNWHVPLGYPKRSHVATVRKVLEQVVKKMAAPQQRHYRQLWFEHRVSPLKCRAAMPLHLGQEQLWAWSLTLGVMVAMKRA